MTLSEWLDQYRVLSPTGVTRTVSDPVDEWEEPELLAPTDRVRDTTPRWRERAARVGYARLTG